jgi:hypothetical protein
MKRSIGTMFSAAVAALALSACGGGTSGSGSLPAGPHAASGAARHAMSTCTPDSYGYCLALVSQDQEPGVCGPHGFQYTVETDSYQLYCNNTFQHYYTYSNSGGTGCPPAMKWSPQDPATATGDPNLP